MSNTHAKPDDDKVAGTMKAIEALNKAPATGDGPPKTIPCPACGTGTLKYVKGKHGRREFLRAACSTPDCVRMMS